MFSSDVSGKSEQTRSHGGSPMFGRQNCSDMHKELGCVMTTRCLCLCSTSFSLSFVHTPNNNMWSAPHPSQMCPWIKKEKKKSFHLSAPWCMFSHLLPGNSLSHTHTCSSPQNWRRAESKQSSFCLHIRQCLYVAVTGRDRGETASKLRKDKMSVKTT